MLKKLNNSKQLPTNADVGGELGDPDTGRPVVLELDENKTGVQKFDVVEFTFMPGLNLDRVNNTDTKLQIRADSGRWHISDLSLRPAMDTGFSPDEFNIVVPLPRSQRPDKLDIFIEYFDINNTTVETVTVRKDIPVSGSPLIIDGEDNWKESSTNNNDLPYSARWHINNSSSGEPSWPPSVNNR